MQRKNATVNEGKTKLKSHQDAKVCYIRGKVFLKKFDHCHYKGKYRGAAHNFVI